MLEEVRDDEIEDVDNMDFDPADFDPRNPFAKSNALTTRSPFGEVPTTDSGSSSGYSSGEATPKSASPAPQADGASWPKIGGVPVASSEADMEQFKEWQVVYPVYFDASKSHAEGRRVSKELAVKNPTAQVILQGCQAIGVRTVFEVTKTHPKDWANPGRIRVQLRDGTSRAPIKNKRHLYILLAKYLQENPVDDQTPLKWPIYKQLAQRQMIEVPEKAEPLAVPEGWKINNVLPIISRAIGGGGASEQMMNQMKDQMFPGMSSAPEPKKKMIKVRANR